MHRSHFAQAFMEGAESLSPLQWVGVVVLVIVFMAAGVFVILSVASGNTEGCVGAAAIGGTLIFGVYAAWHWWLGPYFSSR